jgi:uncharacterized protein (DUF488 family)
MTQVFTIGHSTLSYVQFVTRLKNAGVNALADVRTSPFSRYTPHFNQDHLKQSLKEDGISYVFLGKELGGRPRDPEYFTHGIADYEKMATSRLFKMGLDRVEQGAHSHHIALMCSERCPLDCHRCLLVGRALVARGMSVTHLLSGKEELSHHQIEGQLLQLEGQSADDMFCSLADRVNEAYRKRNRKVAFAESGQALHVAGAR